MIEFNSLGIKPGMRVNQDRILSLPPFRNVPLQSSGRLRATVEWWYTYRLILVFTLSILMIIWIDEGLKCFAHPLSESKLSGSYMLTKEEVNDDEWNSGSFWLNDKSESYLHDTNFIVYSLSKRVRPLDAVDWQKERRTHDENCPEEWNGVLLIIFKI